MVLVLAILFGGLSIFFRAMYALVGRVGHYESKKKAQLRQRGARTLYLLHQKGYEPLVSFTFWQMLFTILFILCLISLFSTLISVVIATLVLTLGGELIGSFYAQNILRRRLDVLWPVVDKFLLLTKPFAKPLANGLEKRFDRDKPTIYSREHLLAVIESHSNHKISDIENNEVELVQRALSFSRKQVRNFIIPLSQVPVIAADSEVGPVLLDELHRSNYDWFPVNQGHEQHISGIASLHKLMSLNSGGKVNQAMEREASFVSEESPLRDVLDMFAATHQTAFLVTNRFDDVVGLLSLTAVISELTGLKTHHPELDELEKTDET